MGQTEIASKQPFCSDYSLYVYFYAKVTNKSPANAYYVGLKKQRQETACRSTRMYDKIQDHHL